MSPLESFGPLLTVPELAHWLHIKEPTIRKKVCHNRIPFVRIGRAIRFRRDEIEAWLKDQEHPARYIGSRCTKPNRNDIIGSR